MKVDFLGGPWDTRVIEMREPLQRNFYVPIPVEVYPVTPLSDEIPYPKVKIAVYQLDHYRYFFEAFKWR